MKSVNIKKEVSGELDPTVEAVTLALKEQGFGVLTRIDLHAKIKEKLGKDLRPTVILGACNPALAYDSYLANPDVSSLLPCNAVIRDLGNGKLSVELARPTALMEMLGDARLVELAKEADAKLETALKSIRSSPEHRPTP